jgi:hypothetical protein
MVTIADTPNIKDDWNQVDYTVVANSVWAATDYSMYIGLITYNAEDFCENVYDGEQEDCDTYIEDADLDFDEDDNTGDLVVAYMYQEDITFSASPVAFGGCIEETGQCWGYAFTYDTVSAYAYV